MLNIAKNLGYSFYLMQPKQNYEYLIQKFNYCEGILISRDDLKSSNWEYAWKIFEYIIQANPHQRFSFHFPMNDCTYIDDCFIYNRLVEALLRSQDLGISKVVIHSNVVLNLDHWQNIDLSYYRSKCLETLNLAQCESGTKVLICLENMPFIGANSTNADPLFIHPSDFTMINGTGIKITWDICHFFQVIKTAELCRNGFIKKKHIKRLVGDPHFFDLKNIVNYIEHWHFSGFNGITIPYTNTICQEGSHPLNSLVPEFRYIQALKVIAKNIKSKKFTAVILEINELDYTHRENIYSVSNWIIANS
jgi:hypothetical protein